MITKLKYTLKMAAMLASALAVTHCATTEESREPCACTALKDVQPVSCPAAAVATSGTDLGGSSSDSTGQSSPNSGDAQGTPVATNGAAPIASVGTATPVSADTAATAPPPKASPTMESAPNSGAEPKYVEVDKLGPEPVGSAAPAAETKIAKEYIVNIAALNVRAGPSMEFPVVKTLSKGERVTMSQREGIWAMIGNNQYVSLNFLEDAGSTITH